MKVFEALQQVKDGRIADKYFGICHSVEDILGKNNDDWNKRQEACFRDWPEFSGSIEYPVPSNNPGVRPSTAYLRTSFKDMWNPKHQYGAARLRLLDHATKWYKERDL